MADDKSANNEDNKSETEDHKSESESDQSNEIPPEDACKHCGLANHPELVSNSAIQTLSSKSIILESPQRESVLALDVQPPYHMTSCGTQS